MEYDALGNDIEKTYDIDDIIAALIQISSNFWEIINGEDPNNNEISINLPGVITGIICLYDRLPPFAGDDVILPLAFV
ncbi:MAG: hypothetical protein LBU64_07745 [Planctomycetota bacterium]|nr:hypothetical protein [Planctomycetota bacterium]